MICAGYPGGNRDACQVSISYIAIHKTNKKGILSIISSDPLCKDGDVRFKQFFFHLWFLCKGLAFKKQQRNSSGEIFGVRKTTLSSTFLFRL